MKPSYAAALAFVVLASCGPDMATINSANERAERAAKRTQAAQLRSERFAELAAEAAERIERTRAADFTEYPDGSSTYGEGSARWWAMKAEAAAEGMCSFAMPLWSKENPPPSEDSLYLRRQRACQGPLGKN
jgi:hypothetical protein